MALKKFAQTRWTIEPQSVTLYPYRIFKLLGIVFAIIFAVFGVIIFAVLYKDSVDSMAGAIPVVLSFVAVVLLMLAGARTHVVFDNQTRVMRKKLFGIIPVKSERFDDLENLNIVRNTMGGFNYRAFPKRDKYGKGTVISAGYGKDADPNATALTQEVFPIIHGYLSQGYATSTPAKMPITTFKYYTVNPPYYAVKKNMIGGLILGLCLIAFGVYVLIDESFTANTDTFHKVLLLLATLGGGIGLVYAAFTKIIFDNTNKTVSRVSPFSSKVYHFADFVSFQITRRTTNAVYSGTDINMYFRVPNTDKQIPLVIKQFRSTKKIDLFLEETRAIMGIDK